MVCIAVSAAVQTVFLGQTAKKVRVKTAYDVWCFEAFFPCRQLPQLHVHWLKNINIRLFALHVQKKPNNFDSMFVCGVNESSLCHSDSVFFIW